VTVSVAPPAPTSASSINAIASSPSPSASKNNDDPVSFKTTYDEVQHQQGSSSAQLSVNVKAAPAKTVSPIKKDPRETAVVELASPPAAQKLPLSLQLSAVAKSNAAVNPNSTAIGKHPLAPTAEDAAPQSAPEPDVQLPPLPKAASPNSSNDDLTFALRLLGHESQAAPDASTNIAQPEPAGPATPALPIATKPIDAPPVSAPPVAPVTTLPLTTPKNATPTAPLALPTGKEIAASGPQVPLRESAPTNQAATAKDRAASATDSPKVAPKQSTQEESAKGNDSHSNSDSRDTALTAPLKTVDAKLSTATFADVHDVASTAAPEPPPSNPPAPLASHADSVIPVKTNEVPAPLTANNISLRLNGPDQTTATVRVLDRSGEIHVSVRASDPQLATTLRSDVDQLRSHLTSRGFDTEVWKPEGAPALREASNHANSGQEHAFNGKRDTQGQSQSRQQQNSGKRPAWLDELEKSVGQGGSKS
jgi:hypothetical protein